MLRVAEDALPALGAGCCGFVSDEVVDALVGSMPVGVAVCFFLDVVFFFFFFFGLVSDGVVAASSHDGVVDDAGLFLMLFRFAFSPIWMIFSSLAF